MDLLLTWKKTFTSENLIETQVTGILPVKISPKFNPHFSFVADSDQTNIEL